MYRKILPEVNRQLHHWRTNAEKIDDPELRRQALASIDTKKFHCQGGAVYAVAAKGETQRKLIAWIVAFQTISDYLDNLCDRSTSLDADDFRCLHQAMLDAVDSQRPMHQYYAKRSEQDDGGYLQSLVLTCQLMISELPGFSSVEADMKILVGLYCDLQVHKHIRHDLREPALDGWWQSHRDTYPDLLWQEFAAATGSTLGVFCLLACAADATIDHVAAQKVREVYFPGICGLHILLDYLIDQDEDVMGGDLNFCSYYDSDQHLTERFLKMISMAQDGTKKLFRPAFHRMIIEGLLALYLSDDKVRQSPGLRAISKRLLKNGPFSRTFFYWNSKWIRRIF